MIDFNWNDRSPTWAQIIGKKVSGLSTPDFGRDSALCIEFDDGTGLVIEYDWIYRWGVLPLAEIHQRQLNTVLSLHGLAEAMNPPIRVEL